MSTFPTGILGSALGISLPAKSAETERGQLAAADQSRVADSSKQAESAAGVGEMNEQGDTSDRDADGRRLWEAPLGKRRRPESSPPLPGPPGPPVQSKDSTGTMGRNVDLSG